MANVSEGGSPGHLKDIVDVRWEIVLRHFIVAARGNGFTELKSLVFPPDDHPSVRELPEGRVKYGVFLMAHTVSVASVVAKPNLISCTIFHYPCCQRTPCRCTSFGVVLIYRYLPE